MSKVLLNPGPTNTRFMTKVHQWLGSDICHREEDFRETLEGLQKELIRRSSMGPKSKIAVMGGSGTTAMEAMISSVVPDGVTVIDAGSYGKRAIEILKTFSIKYNVIESKTIDDLQIFENIKFVYFVENETSTGENYCLDKMTNIFPNARFFVDATASFGASGYYKHANKIIALSFCSNKCLQSTPGLGMVIWDGTSNTYKRSYYGDLTKYKIGSLPFTLPTQSVHALKHALETNKNNKNIFDKRRDLLVKETACTGIECLSSNPANSIIAFKHPKRSYEDLHDFLDKRGFIIYSGVPGISYSFRMSTMSVKFDKKYSKMMTALNDSCR